MKSVWVTRTEPGASRLAAWLTQKGFAAFARPVLAIQPLSPWRAIVNGVPVAPTVDAVQPPTVVCAMSAHAVEAFAAAGLAARVGEARFVAVGENTAGALRTLGFDAELPRTPTSEGLLSMSQLQALGAQDTIWILAGSGGRDVLERNLLHARRASVVKLELYRRTGIVPEAELEAAGVGAVEVASVQGLEEFARIWQRASGPKSVPLVVPSARVDEAARAEGFSKVYIANGASDEAVLTQLRNLISRNDQSD